MASARAVLRKRVYVISERGNIGEERHGKERCDHHRRHVATKNGLRRAFQHGEHRKHHQRRAGDDDDSLKQCAECGAGLDLHMNYV